jgi:CRP-like cAMP-binding protein
MVGEAALSSADVRAAATHAVGDTTVVRIALPLFWRLASERPELMSKVAHIIVERQQQILKAT